jgi:hypothetical protein
LTKNYLPKVCANSNGAAIRKPLERRFLSVDNPIVAKTLFAVDGNCPFTMSDETGNVAGA